MTAHRVLPLVLAAAFLLPGPGARAFDMLGFRGGMSLDALAAQARAEGYRLTVSGPAGDDLPESAWPGERLLGASLERKEAPGRLAAFLCGGRLQSLSEVSDGGFDEFVRGVAEAQRLFGSTGTAGEAVSRRVTPKHSLSNLPLRWTPTPGGDTYTVELVSASGSTAVHRGWSTRLEGCE